LSEGLGRRAKIAIVLAALSLCCVLGVCAVGASVGPVVFDELSCEPSAPATTPVYTDPQRLLEVLPEIGEVRSVRWQVREARPHGCPDIGPMDFYLDAVVTLPTGTGQKLQPEYGFAPAEEPDVPEGLRDGLPPAPVWQRSTRYNEHLRSQAWLDVATDTLVVSHLRG